MTADRWRQIEELFAKALECPPGEREAFLDEACRGDRDLRREAESLLACDIPEQRLINVPTVLDTDNRTPEPDMAGRRVGAYRLIRMIGRGGMGAVYLGCRDDDQYRKQVAIKLLKRGMDTDFMLSRFQMERQILANLEHPFIARLIDGGATGDGLPYFVMEHVDGVPITNFCDDNKLTVQERLRLFGMVCEAVQYAHQNLVVHRDIKPGNILTTKEGIPKLLDFGIAKMFGPEGAAAVTLTQREQRMLTPDYASPEQIRGLPVSTASDIYSLGAVLYELLTGRRPHRFTSTSPAALEEAICVAERLKPSAAVAENEDLPPDVRKQLRRQLSGDLDNIVLTALRKEPQRRYASAAEFAEDLRRHVEGLPVRAHEDRWTYRAGKFIGRNRLMIGTMALVAVSLIGGIIATTMQARRAEQRFQIVRGLARTMLFDLYSEMEKLPGSVSLRAATIRTVVTYLDTLSRSGSRDPELDLEIATAYERVAALEGHPFYSNLGHGPEALANYRKALALYERLADRSDYRRQATRGLIDTHLKLASMESLLGNPGESVGHSRKASELAKAAFALGPSEVPVDTQINVYARLADLEYDRGEADREVANCRKALALAVNRVAGQRTPATLSSVAEAYRNLGSAQARAGDLTGALESYDSARSAAEEMTRRADAKPDLHFGIVSILTATGDLLAAPDDPNLNDRAGAVDHYRQALTIAERLAAADSQNVNGKRTVAACQWRLCMISTEDQPARAVEHCRQAMRLAEEVGAGDPRNVEYRYHASRAYLWMGEALRNLRMYRDAIDSLTRAVEIQNSIVASAPQKIWNLRVLSRSYVFLAAAQLDGDYPNDALVSLRKGLEVADQILRRAPSSLPHQLDRADVLEGMARHYATLSRRPNLGVGERAEFRRQARSSLEGSVAIWRDWIRINRAQAYAVRRESQAAQAMASLETSRGIASFQ